MAKQLYKNIERLLILEKYVEKLDDTGVTDILYQVGRTMEKLDESESRKNLTPIESLMDIILMGVQQSVENRAGIFMPAFIYTPQVEIGKYRVDFECRLASDREKKFIIECDGHDFHEKTKEQVAYDKQRERYLVSKGYKVLRFSGSEILNDFEQIKDELCDFFYDEYMKSEFGENYRERM